MVIFINDGTHRMIPMHRVYEIYAIRNRIVVSYDSGDIAEYESQGVPVKSEVAVLLNSNDEVEKVIKQFYKALNSGAKAFYFGD